MGSRITKETLYLRHDFNKEERLDMGDKLAEAYNSQENIDAEEAVFKTQFKERRAKIEQTISSISRDMRTGFTMQNVPCSIKYDDPNVGELTYYDPGGKSVKTRAMSESERQMDLPLAGDVVVVPPDESAANIKGFFDPQAIADAAEEGEAEDIPDDEEEGAEEPESDPDDPFTDPDPAAAAEAIKPENDEAFGMDISESKPEKPKRLKGFSKPTNISAF